jgi:hypothetical protein
MVKIALTQGSSALVDKKDYPRLSKFIWYAKEGTSGIIYAIHNFKRSNGKFRPTRMHRFILGLKKGDPLVDHKNQNGLDNRRKNLRICDKSKNAFNRKNIKRSHHTSRYKGVSWMKDLGKWRATITINYKSIHLGLFETEKMAARAYNLFAKKHIGEFACLNRI